MVKSDNMPTIRGFGKNARSHGFGNSARYSKSAPKQAASKAASKVMRIVSDAKMSLLRGKLGR